MRIPMDVSEYPTLGPVISLRPGDIFRVESIAMEHPHGIIYGSGLFTYTGAYEGRPDENVSFIYCVPLYFYGDQAETLSKIYSGMNVWLQITEIDLEVPDNEYRSPIILN